NLFRADAGRPMVVELEAGAERLLVDDPQIQHALAGRYARLQLGIDLFDVRVLPQELEAILQLAHLQRGPAPLLQSVGDIGVAQPFVFVDVDSGQDALDDAHRDDAVRRVLVRNGSARVDVAVADVKQGDSPARILKFRAGDAAVGEGRRDLREVAL